MQKSITRISLCLVVGWAVSGLTDYSAPIAMAAEEIQDSTAGAAISAPAQQAGDESPAQFVQRYLDTVTTAKSPQQIMSFLKPRADRPPMPEATPKGNEDTEDKKMEAKMVAAFMEMQRISTPQKVEVTATQDRGGKVLLLLKATQVDPQAKLNLNEKGSSATGKMLLEKGPSGWLVIGQYWHYVYANGLTTDTGQDPDAAPKVATPIDKYTDDIMLALNKIWPDPAPAKSTGQVTVELKNSSSGQFEVLGIKDKNGSKEAEASVREAIAKIELPPLPPEVAEQPIVNIQLCWSPKAKDTLKLVQLLPSATIVK